MTRPTPPRVVPPTRRDLATVTRHSQVRPALGRVVAAIKRGHGLGDVVAAGPVNVRVKPCGGGAEVTLRHAEAPVTTGQLWLDAHPDAERPTVQTGLAL